MWIYELLLEDNIDIQRFQELLTFYFGEFYHLQGLLFYCIYGVLQFSLIPTLQKQVHSFPLSIAFFFPSNGGPYDNDNCSQYKMQIQYIWHSP